MSIDRRTFLKTAVAASTAAVIPFNINRVVASLQPDTEILTSKWVALTGKHVSTHLRKALPYTIIQRRIKKNIVLDGAGAKHLDIRVQMTAWEMALPDDEFVQQVAAPMVQVMQYRIENYNKPYASVQLPKMEHFIHGIFNYRGISIRVIQGYDMGTMCSYLAVDTYLKEV